MNIFKSSSWDRIWIQKFCAVGVDVGLVELKYRFNVGEMEGEGGRLHTENQLDTMPGSAGKVYVGGGWWWWWLRANLVISFGLAST